MIQEIPIANVRDWIDHEFTSDWVLIDQKKITAFAEVTDDHNWVHVDVEKSIALRGTTIAHGILIFALLPGLVYKLFTFTGIKHALNYGADRVRFTGIVNTNTRVRLRIKLVEVTERGEGVVIKSAFIFDRENEAQPACVGELAGIMYPAES